MTARRAALAATLALTLPASACGSSGSSRSGASEAAADESSPTTTTTTVVPTTTTEPSPPGGRRPTAEDPLRVLMAGDSLMADISLAISSTLQDGGSAVASLVAAPSIPRDDATRALWQRQLDTYDPEVIVVMIGVWEGMGVDAEAQQALGSLEWEQAYRRDLLDPYLQLLTSEGAEVVWIGMPPSPDAQRELEWSSINRAVRQLAEESPDLSWIPGDEILANPDGSWTDVLPGPQGNPQRVRRLDTTHLCAEGVVRLARPVLDHLQQQWDVPLAEDWPNRDWRWVFPPDECPPAAH